MKIAVLGGGNMGGAVAIGAIRQGVVKPTDVTISHLSEKMTPLMGDYINSVKLTSDNSQAIADADFIVVAVKPWLAEQVLGEISSVIDRKRQSIISVIAGLSFEQIGKLLDFDQLGVIPIYRVIPNTAISIGCGLSTISSCGATQQGLDKVVELFEALGTSVVTSEDMMTPFTSLSSCGIAFALRYLEASMNAGHRVGIDKKMSLDVTIQTMKGAIALLEKNGSEPQSEIDKVTTKGGITLKGLEAMEREGFSQAVECAILESR